MLQKVGLTKNTNEIGKSQLKGVRAGLLSNVIEEDLVDQFIILKDKHTITKVNLKHEKAVLLVNATRKETILCEIDCAEGNIVVPHLSILHRFPDLMKKVFVDKGAIKYMVDGANVMAPGLLKTQKLPEFEKGDLLAVFCEGKQHAVAIVQAEFPSEQVSKMQKGQAFLMVHHLGDQFWSIDSK